MIGRVEQFCMKIEEWDREKHELISNERRVFVSFIEKVVARGEREAITREVMVEELQKIEMMGFYVDCI